jgi:hypothetical protein
MPKFTHVLIGALIVAASIAVYKLVKSYLPTSVTT